LWVTKWVILKTKSDFLYSINFLKPKIESSSGTIFPFAGEAAKPRKFGDRLWLSIPRDRRRGRFSRMVRGLRGDIVLI